MQNVTIVGTEDNALVLANENGEQFMLTVDDAVRAAVRQLSPSAAAQAAHIGPREVQAKVREGLSPEEVASLFGVEPEFVDRFAAPVLAEREHMLNQALALPVLSGQVEAEPSKTFGNSIRAKLAAADVSGERWASWKDANGWIIKLTFILAGVERDARWAYDPRAATLTPFNDEAARLTRQAPASDGLIPRLRALDNAAAQAAPTHETAPAEPEFFDNEELEDLADDEAPVAPVLNATGPIGNEATSDLLEALRRKRGQRADTAPSTPATTGSEDTSHDYPAPVSLFDSFDEVARDPSPAHPASQARDQAGESHARRKRRSEMPSWDDIVFGTRGDDA